MPSPSETWARLINLGVVTGPMPEQFWDLSGKDLSRADLIGAKLSMANLIGANLSRADLSGASLGKANLFQANLFQADLRKADLRKADLSRADLSKCTMRDAILLDTNFNNADLSGADITGSMFWHVSTFGWKINNIIADFLYLTDDISKKGESKREFKKGQFEALYRHLPTIEIVFDEGFSPRDIFALNYIVELIKKEKPGTGIELTDFSNKGGYPRAIIEVLKEEFLPEIGKLLEEKIRQAQKGIPLDSSTMKNLLPFDDMGRPSGSIVIKDSNISIIIGNTGNINQIQARSLYIDESVFIQYNDNKEIVEKTLAEFKAALEQSQLSIKEEMKTSTDQLLTALKENNLKMAKTNADKIFKGIGRSADLLTIFSSACKALGVNLPL